MATYMYAYRIISLAKGRRFQSRLLDKDMPIATFLEFNLFYRFNQGTLSLLTLFTCLI